MRCLGAKYLLDPSLHCILTLHAPLMGAGSDVQLCGS